MGWETLAFTALMGVNAASQMSAAKKEAKATIAGGNLAMQNKAIEVRRRASAAQVSFLNSGLTLEGTPMGAIMGIYDTGAKDVAQIGDIYNAKSKNIISSARSKIISDFATSAAGASFSSGLGNFAADVGAGFSTMGNPFDFSGFDLGYSASGAFRNANTALSGIPASRGG